MSDAITPDTCPERAYHGHPFRYCPVKGCGWMEDTPLVKTGLPRLKWVQDHGQLAAALGVSSRLEPIVQRVLDAGGGIRAVLDTVQREAADCTFEEWTALVFALGHMDGAR